MNDNIAELKEDILKKFDQLCLIQVQPALFVTERFDEIRNEIDLGAEKIINGYLQKEKTEDNETTSESSSDSDSDNSDDDNDDADAPTKAVLKESRQDVINSFREGYLHILKTREDSILENLSANEKIGQGDFSDLKQKVDEFLNKSYESSSINEAEDDYTRLALMIMDEIRQLEREALGLQTFFYWPSKVENSFGQLVHISDEYFTPEEIEFLK